MNDYKLVPVEQQPITSSLACEAAAHLTNWLNMHLCECEGGHTCGANEVRRTRDSLLALTEQQPECGCCGQVGKHDDDCDAVVIGGNRPAPDVQGEPVAWRYRMLSEDWEAISPSHPSTFHPDHEKLIIEPLYTAPQPAEQQENVSEGWRSRFLKFIGEMQSELDESNDDPIPSGLWSLWRELLDTAPQPVEQQPAPDVALTIADYEEVLAGHRCLTRELDVLLNGENGAAQQASLCDLVAQLRTVVRNAGRPVLAAPDVTQLVETLSGLLLSLCIHEGEDVVGRVKGTWSVEAEEAARADLAAYRKGGE